MGVKTYPDYKQFGDVGTMMMKCLNCGRVTEGDRPWGICSVKCADEYRAGGAMSETKRTPGPWQVKITRSPGYPALIEVLGDSPIPVVPWRGFDEGDRPIKEHEANAAFIVRAVNNFEPMLEALEQIARGEGAFSRDPLQHASNCIEEMKAMARAAIAKAKGE